MTFDAEAIVLGLGIHGAAAAFELASRGVRVVGIEQFAPGHGRGSSHGATRMIRRAYPHPDWNDFVADAYRGWERWERLSSQRLVHRTGGLYAHPGEGALQGGRSAAIDPTTRGDLLAGFAVPVGYSAVYDPDAGVVEAQAARAWAADAARLAGAELSYGETVLDWVAEADGVRVRTDRRELRAERLVLAGGPWLSRLLPALAPAVEVWRILTYSARPGQEAARAPRLGSFSVARDEGLVFGLPEVAGHGAKIGVDAGPLWDPAEPVAPATTEEIDGLRDLFARYAPEVDLTDGEATACLYTMTRDKRFIIGAVPDAPRVLVAAACSGHGFKFGPAVGEAIADLVDGIDRPDLDFLRPDREALS